MALGCAALSLLLAVSCSSDDGSAGPPHTLVDASSDGNAEASLDAGLSDGWADGPDPDAAAEDAGVDAGPCGSEVPTVGATKNPRGSNSPAFARPSYDYAPSVMHDGVYRMWWCGGIAGDHILYAEAASLDGPWHAHGSTAPNSYDDVFSPTGVVGDFDGAHTCDPSVVRVSGTYVMFYGGLGKDGTPNNTTRIGVAQSDDGFSWTRLNGGKPIIIVAVTKDLIPRGIKAGDIVRDVAKVVGGGGGGRPDMAQAGGKDASKLPEALALVPSLIEAALK